MTPEITTLSYAIAIVILPYIAKVLWNYAVTDMFGTEKVTYLKMAAFIAFLFVIRI